MDTGAHNIREWSNCKGVGKDSRNQHRVAGSRQLWAADRLRPETDPAGAFADSATVFA
jgi:hypothetical protein